MHFLLLGASGRTGQITLSTALARGHTVTALVRKRSSLSSFSDPKLHIVEGTPLSPEDLSRAFSGASPPIDVVIVALGVQRASDSPFAGLTGAPHFLRDAMRATLAQMQAHGVRRLVVMSSFGAAESWSVFPWAFKALFMSTPMKHVLADHTAVDAEVKASQGVQWTMIRPTILKGEESKPVKDMGALGKGVGMFDGVSRASVAEELVKAAEVEGQRGSGVAKVIIN